VPSPAAGRMADTRFIMASVDSEKAYTKWKHL
jgi:hypothetical protein